MNINYLTCGIIFLLCIVSTYTDRKENIIKNKYLLSIGCLALISNWISFYLYMEANIKEYFVTIGMSLCFCFLLYFMKIWAGGDCKLYLFIVLGVPSGFVTKTFFHLSLLLWIPLFAFFMGYIYIIYDSFQIKRKESKKDFTFLKNVIPSFFTYLKNYILLLFVNRVISSIFFSINTNFQISWIIMVLDITVLLLVTKAGLLRYRSIIVTLIIADVVFCIFDGNMLLNRNTLMLWLLVIITGIIRNFADQYNYEEMDINDLKEGMILSTASSVLIANDPQSTFTKISDESLDSRLTSDEVELIKSWSFKRKVITQISIVKKVPFALFLAISTILILTGGIIL